MLVGILVPIAFFIGVFTMIIFLRKYENDERMAMIAKGMNPVNTTKLKINPSGTLRFALLAIGAGVGLVVGSMLEKANLVEEEVAYFSMVLLFGGMGLLVSYLIQLKQDEKEKEKQLREREIV
ncbi:MAG TPA: DUF6249 domain-containing protein [Cytophagales bacterium]|jgi:uncharacterized membrane protein YgaE (UPF0421/DUF939 family)